MTIHVHEAREIVTVLPFRRLAGKIAERLSVIKVFETASSAN